MAPGARNKFGIPMFEPKVFREQMYNIEESTYNIVGTFRRPPPVIRRQGIVRCPSVRPWMEVIDSYKFKQVWAFNTYLGIEQSWESMC